jgi:polysaccharide biosynthesis/export protein
MIRSFTSLLTLAFACLSLFAGAAAAQDYKLRAGDTIRIEVLEDQTINRSLLIAPDGRVSLPLAGVVSAAGRSIESLQAELVSRLAPSFASPPTVYVALEKQKDPRPSTGGVAAAPVGTGVYILGEAGKPGRLEVKPGTTLLQLFSQMGGFTKFAATKRIQLRRGNQIFLFDYKAIEAGTSNAGSTTISDGDVIVVPQRKLFE